MMDYQVISSSSAPSGAQTILPFSFQSWEDFLSWFPLHISYCFVTDLVHTYAPGPHHLYHFANGTTIVPSYAQGFELPP
jgi:hypothetical protein